MSHLTELPRENSEQTVYRICSIVHNFLDENFEMLDPAPMKYKKTVFGKAEATVFDTIVESSPLSQAILGLSETSRPVPKTNQTTSQLSDFRSTVVQNPNRVDWKFFAVKALVFLAIGVLAGMILLQL